MSKTTGLRRGLKDISELFQQPDSEIRSTAAVLENQIMTLAVYNPEKSESTCALNRLLVQCLTKRAMPCSMISLYQEAGELPQPHHQYTFPNELSLSWSEFNDLCSRPLARNGEKKNMQHAVLFNCRFNQTFHFPALMPVLDKWILLVRPEVEYLMDAYKMIKGTHQLNSHLQYYLMFDGDWQTGVSEAIYEKFSAMVLNNFRINLTWLGHLGSRTPVDFTVKAENLEPLFFETLYLNATPGKQAVSDYALSFFSHQRKTAV